MPAITEQVSSHDANPRSTRNIWDGTGDPLLPYCVFGLPFHALSFTEVVASLRDAMRLKRHVFLSTPNVNFLVACQSDPVFRDTVILSDLSVPDGMPIVWMAKLLGIPIAQRVAGANLFEALYMNAVGSSAEQRSVYFFGGPDGAAQAACENLNRYPAPEGTVPALRCVGYASPGFGSIEDMSSPAIVSHINASKADFLLVALGARKGQNWILHNQSRLTPTVVSHLGAVVNFVAGTIHRAPPYFQRVGMEWLWRINQEPGLWQRYFKDAVLLLGLLVLRGVPQVLLEKTHGTARSEAAKATFEIAQSNTRVNVKLHGVWVSSNRYRLWSALQGAVSHDLDVHIDLSGVEFVDCALLGLLLHLRGTKMRQKRLLKITGASRRVQRTFYFSCVAYLLDA
jgi:N-acetylglucosaminyldiphosphoundecaprenol N-acetyl-beta-D-mannosaminyltransferase